MKMKTGSSKCRWNTWKKIEAGSAGFRRGSRKGSGRCWISGSALAGAVPAPGRKGAGAATCARGAAPEREQERGHTWGGMEL